MISRFRKILSLFTAGALFFSLMTGIPFGELTLGITASAASDPAKLTFDVSEGSITIYADTISYGSSQSVSYTSGEEITITGTTSANTVTVAENVSANITLSGVKIDVSKIDGEAAFKIEDNSTGNVAITLENRNTLISGNGCAGLQKNGKDTGKLTIKSSNGRGSLNATGGDNAAGIGGGDGGSGSNITVISKGRVTATGGTNGAGIGGGNGGSGSDIIIEGKTVTVTGGNNAAGIGGGNNGSGSNITVNSGTVTATGGDNGTGIGGGNNGSGSDITVNSGTVTATGGTDGTGIGGGKGGSGSNITVNGGTITATGGTNGAGIGGVDGSGSNFSFKGGTIILTKNTVIPVDNSFTIGSGAVFELKDVTLTNNGTITNNGIITGESTSTNGTVTYNGDITNKGTITNDGIITVNSISGNGNINGSGLIGGDTQKYDGRTLNIANGNIVIGKDTITYGGVPVSYTAGQEITITGTTKTNTIMVEKDVSANITLNSVNINTPPTYLVAAFQIADDSKGDVNITLVGENTLISGAYHAGLQKNGGKDTGKLTINGTGSLHAESTVDYGAGIGAGGKNDSSSNIFILGGAVTAIGGEWAAGIGGSGSGSGSDITISDGTVTAIGGSNAAGIGGSYDFNGTGTRSGSDITISGGTVTATGGSNAAGIGGGNSGSGSGITISGGTVEATGGSYAAGIGGGNTGSGSDITISNGKVTVEGKNGADDIGGSGNGSGSNIVINGGSVNAINDKINNPDADRNGTDHVYRLDLNTNGNAVTINTANGDTYIAPSTHDKNIVHVYLPAGNSDKPNKITLTDGTSNADSFECYYYIDPSDSSQNKWIYIKTVEAPTGLTATYGDMLLSVEFPTNSTDSIGQWAWDYPADELSAKTVGDVGDNKFYAKYTFSDNSYSPVTMEVTVTVRPAEISEIVITGIDAPEAGKDLDTSAETSADKYTLSKVEWSDIDNKADYSGAYNAVVTATMLTDNYIFAGNAKASEIVGAASVSVNVSANGKSAEVTYSFGTTADAKVNSIFIKTEPSKLAYLIGEKLDVKGGFITAHYEDGSEIDVEMTADMVTGFDSNSPGSKLLTVKYQGFEAKFTVSVGKAASILRTPPEAISGLLCNGAEQALVNAGTAENGIVVYSLDGENYYETIPTAKSAGEYTVWYKVRGNANYTDTEPQSLKVTIGHTLAAEWTWDETKHWHICSGCGEKFDYSDHMWNNGIVTLEPTETTDGVKTYTCTACGATKTEPVTNIEHTHTPVSEWTRDETGHWHICSGCTEKVGFAAHTEDSGTITVQPTEDSAGVKTYSCTVCGYIIRTETIPTAAEEHTHGFSANWNYDSTSHWQECVCGERAEIDNHISDGGIVTAQPTYYSTGVRTYSCVVCGYSMHTESIPVLEQDCYPNYNPFYNDFNPFVNIISGYNFERLRLTGRIKGNSVILSWTGIEDADEYTVYQLIDGKYKAIKITTDTTYTVESLATGKYKFIVRYTVNGRLSPTSKTNSLTVYIKNNKPYPTAAVKGSIVTIKWQEVDNAEKYAVYLVRDGRARKLKETDKRIVKYALESGKEYQFVVRAYVDGKWTVMKTSDIIFVSAEN